MASLWMLMASFIFALMGAFVKLASAFYSTSEIVMARGVAGVLLLSVLMRVQGGTLRTSRLREHVWRGMIGVVSLWLWFFAISALPLSTAMTLNYMAPIWVAVILFMAGWWHAKDHVEWPLIVAIVMSFVGVTLVLRPAFAAQQWLGGVLGLASGVVSGFAYMQVRRLGQLGEPDYRVVFFFSVFTLLAGLLGSFTTMGSPDGAAWHRHTLYSASLLAGVGICGTLAQMAMTRAYRTGKTLVVANLQYSGIIFSSAWAMLIWGDHLEWHTWLGMGVILASGIAATFYNTRSTERGTAVTDTDPIASE